MSVPAGLTLVPGVATAGAQNDPASAEESPFDVTTETVTEDGEIVTFSVAEHKETGEEAAAILEMDQPDTKTTDDSSLERHGDQSLDPHESTTQSIKESDPNEVREVITQIRDGEDGLQTFDSHGGWSGVIDDLPTEAEDYVVQAGWYLNELGSCDADVWDVDEHCQFGVTIEWTDFVDDLMTSIVFSTIIGAVLSAAATYAVTAITGPTATIPTAIAGLAGGAVGALAGILWDNFKDTRYLTFAFQDFNACALDICAPASKFVGSGRYDDQSENIGAVGYFPVHLEDYDMIGTSVPTQPMGSQMAVASWITENALD